MVCVYGSYAGVGYTNGRLLEAFFAGAKYLEISKETTLGGLDLFVSLFVCLFVCLFALLCFALLCFFLFFSFCFLLFRLLVIVA